MQKRQRIILIVFLISSLVLIVFLLNSKNKNNTPTDKVPAPTQQVQSAPKNETSTSQKTLVTEEVSGPIVKIGLDSITINKPTGAVSIKFDLNSTPVFKGKNKVKASPLDLKAGISVSVTVNQETKTATEIVVQ
jgi:hypothetical protein